MINELAKQVHENAKAHGFFDEERNIGEMLYLIHSEVLEALEADREGNNASMISIEDLNEIPDNAFFIHAYKEDVKGTFEEEMADIIIR